ncbi:MAG: CPBP family glutamic-type intramembrane protease [Methanobacterium sp.]
MDISDFFKNNQLKIFLFLTFLISWAVWFSVLLGKWGPVPSVGTFGPAIAAIIVFAIIKPKKIGEQSLKRWVVFAAVFILAFGVMYAFSFMYSLPAPLISMILLAALASYIISGGLSSTEGIKELLSKIYIWKVGLKWYIFILIILPLIFVLPKILLNIANGFPNELQFSGVGFILFFGFVFLFGGPLNEEPGWRGFALPRLQNFYSPLTASIILALIWAFWHFPLHLLGFYSGGYIEPFILRIITTIPLTIIITWIYNNTQASLLLVILTHTSENVFTNTVLTDSSMDLTAQLITYGILGLIAIIAIIKNKMWHKLPENSDVVYQY